jgi:tRNA(Ile)-lysidine synthase
VIRSGDILHPEVLERLFAPLRGASAILVAVSGGPDSVALLHLLARWQTARSGPGLIAATVDHGLRSESSAEAARVAGQAAQLGIPHRTLVWTGPKPEHGLQAAAREKRYALLLAQALRDGASHLVTAHTIDDQAETILMRLARGSGLAGLAGMRPEVEREGIRHVRPLLAVPKVPLVDLCRTEGWEFVEDPSNIDDRFSRARWRKLLPALAAEGLTAERLTLFAARARRAEEALHAQACRALAEARSGSAGDPNLVEAVTLRDEPFEVAVRVLALLVQDGPAEDRLRLERVETAAERLRAALGEGRALRLSLAGRVLDLDRKGYLRIRAEPLRRRGRYICVSDDDAGDPASLGNGGRHA